MAKFNPNRFATLTIPADQHRPAARHSQIENVDNDVYIVRGKMPSTPSRPLFERVFLYYSRTMTIVRRKNNDGIFELALINTIRLNDKTLAKLSKLGEIRNVVRLGAFHGVDDAFYVQRYDATYWVVDGMTSALGLNVKPELLAENNLPIPGAQLFSFHKLTYPEAIIILPPTGQTAGMAITTDAIQNHTSIFDIDNSPLVSLAIWCIGLVGRARLGPIWMRDQVPTGISTEAYSTQEKRTNMVAFFRPQYESLLANYDFDMLIPGHGWPIYKGAKEAIKASIDQQLRY